MAVTDWIDDIAKLWGTLENGQGELLRSYRVFEKAEVPEALSIYPCAISYVSALSSLSYTAAGIALWRGTTEIHVYPNTSKANIPGLMLWYERITVKAASSLQLGGKVDHFKLAAQDPIRAATLQYASEDYHHGLVINWQVKEKLALALSA